MTTRNDSDSDTAPATLADPHWSRLLEVATKYLRKKFHKLGLAAIEDVAQEAMLGLYAEMRRGAIDNLEARATILARNRAIDTIRRNERRKTTPIDTAILADGGEGVLQDAERILLQVFEAVRGTPCAELTRARLDGVRWADVAQSHGVSVDAIRKRWQRCQDLFEPIFSDHPRPIAGLRRRTSHR